MQLQDEGAAGIRVDKMVSLVHTVFQDGVVCVDGHAKW